MPYVTRRLSFPSSFSSSFYHGRMMKQHLVNTWLVDNDLTLRLYSKSKKYNRWKFSLVDLLNSSIFREIFKKVFEIIHTPSLAKSTYFLEFSVQLGIYG